MKERMAGPCPDRRTLQAYLSGTLSDEERHRVERHALDCPLCAAALDGMSRVPTAEQATETDLQGIRDQVLGRRSNPGASSLFRRRLWTAAAALVGLILVSWLVWYYVVGRQPYRLYLQAFDLQPVEAYRAVRSLQPTEALDERIVRGLTALRDREELAALAAFRNYLDDFPAPEDGRPLLYAGMLSLSTGYVAEARGYFDRIRREYPDLRPDATWYLALAYLRENDPGRARPLLEQLTRPGEYQWSAERLLDEL